MLGLRHAPSDEGGGFGWLSGHPVVVDVTLAAVVGAVTGLADALGHDRRSHGALEWDLALAAVLVLRRIRPAYAAVLAGGICLAQWAVDVRASGDVAVLVVLYSLAAYERRRWLLVLAIVTAQVGVIMAVTRWGAPSNRITAGVTGSGTVIAAWVMGIFFRTRRAYLASIRERAETAERERDSQARIAVAAERARLAREMHDVIAHSLAVMITLNDGAAAMEPSTAVSDVLSQASDVGRQALGEMDRILAVLRDGEAAELVPQPGLGELPGLVTMVRSAGLQVELAVTGDLATVPSTAQLAAYRIAQESLTNVLKHARNVRRVKVALTRRGPRLEVRVNDDGSAVAGREGLAGHGLSGMGERARMFGGEVAAGPDPEGGWTVRAWLDLGHLGAPS